MTALAAVDAEKPVPTGANPDPTPGPTVIFEGEKLNLAAQGYPVAEVIGHQTTYDLADQITKSATHVVEIVWTQVGDEERLITTHLERLIRATRDLFWPPTGPALIAPLGTWPIVVVSESYTALMPARAGVGGAFVKGSALTLHVMTETL